MLLTADTLFIIDGSALRARGQAQYARMSAAILP